MLLGCVMVQQKRTTLTSWWKPCNFSIACSDVSGFLVSSFEVLLSCFEGLIPKAQDIRVREGSSVRSCSLPKERFNRKCNPQDREAYNLAKRGSCCKRIACAAVHVHVAVIRAMMHMLSFFFCLCDSGIFFLFFLYCKGPTGVQRHYAI